MKTTSTQSRFEFLNSFIDFANPEEECTAEIAIPTQLRGERLGQEPVVPYIMGDGQMPLPVSLQVIHEQRTILVQADIAYANTVDAEWPTISKRKKRMAKRLLESFRSKFVGRRAVFSRFILRQRNPYLAEGPFIPRQHGIALMSVLIRVNRDGNFDEAYDEAKKFLDLHPLNESVNEARILAAKQNAPKGKAWEKTSQAYCWTNEELEAVEKMARLDPTNNNETNMARRRKYNYNLIVEARTGETILEHEDYYKPPINNAAHAAESALCDYFNS